MSPDITQCPQPWASRSLQREPLSQTGRRGRSMECRLRGLWTVKQEIWFFYYGFQPQDSLIGALLGRTDETHHCAAPIREEAEETHQMLISREGRSGSACGGSREMEEKWAVRGAMWCYRGRRGQDPQVGHMLGALREVVQCRILPITLRDGSDCPILQGQKQDLG